MRIADKNAIVEARKAGRVMAQELGFGSADQTRLATAISELTRNALTHANGGTCSLVDHSNQLTRKIVVIVEDDGPGIADVSKALIDGYTTKKGNLGAGLPGTRRLVSEFEVESRPGCTRVTIALARRR